MNNPIKVLLADDHAIVLEGVRHVLKLHPEIEVCAEVTNGQKVIEYVQQQRPDVIVLDVNMPEMDGITCARKVKSAWPEVKIIILTMYAQKSFIEEIVKIGVEGCLLKNNTGTELKDAIVRVMSGKSYFDQIQNFNSFDETIGTFKLSKREIEIVRLIADGLTNFQIGEKLFIAEDTVKTHRKNIMRKANVNNTSQLIQFCLRNNII